MSVRPTLLKDIRRTAIQQHQASKGKGSYNSFEALSNRPRTFSAGKRQLEPCASDSDSSQAPKTPKLDSAMIFSQLKDQDEVLSDLDKALVSLNSHEDGQNKDPRLDSLCKVVTLLARSQRNLTSAIIDSAKLSEKTTQNTAPAHSGSAHTAAIGAGKKKLIEVVSEEDAKKKR
jgi:hypothetical protein